MKSSLIVLGISLAVLGAVAPADNGDKLATDSNEPETSATEQQASEDSGKEPGTKRADTATAAGAFYKGVKEGKITIEGGTDPGAPGF